MNRREKTLAIVFGVAVGVWILYSVVTSRIIDPLRSRSDQIAALEIQVASKQTDAMMAEQAAEELLRWRRLALPSDPSRAQTLYLEYVRRSLEESGITRPTFRPSPAGRPGEHYTPIGISIEAQCQLRELTRFLKEVAEAPLLHQVRHLRIQPVLKDDRIEAFDCSISLEALAMADSFTKDELPTRETAAEALRDRPRRKIDEFDLFVRKNLFQPSELVLRPSTGGAGPQVVSGRDERKDYDVAASILLDGVSQIWLRHRASQSRKVVTEGGTIEIGGLTATVLKILPDVVLLQVDGKVGSIRIGQNLASWKPMEDAATEETPSSSTNEAASAPERPES